MFALGRLLFLVSYTEQALMASQEHRYRILMIIEGKYLYHLEINVFLLFPNIIVTTKILLSLSPICLLFQVVFHCSAPCKVTIGLLSLLPYHLTTHNGFINNSPKSPLSTFVLFLECCSFEIWSPL